MAHPDLFSSNARYQSALLDGGDDGPKTQARKWKFAATAAGVLAVGMAAAIGMLVQERSALISTRQQLELMTQAKSMAATGNLHHAQADAVTSFARAASRPSATHMALSALSGGDVDKCTVAGSDVFNNNAGVALPCCDGLSLVNTPCRGTEICQYCVPQSNVGDACTVAGTDIFDNNVHVALPCCPGLVKTPTPCRGNDMCEYCQPKGSAAAAVGKACTPTGKDMFDNPKSTPEKAVKQKCCDGLVETMAPCRGDDMCPFCIPSTVTDGPRQEYPPAKISVDPLTPQAAVDKHKKKGMSLIFSDEFKDMARTKSMFVFEDIPYGVPGNTGDVNIVSTYNSDTISLLPEGGLRLAAFMAPEDNKKFMKGWNGTWNSNWGSDVSLWSWHAPKVTTRLNGRFQYGLIETRLKAPKGYGPWPAAWLNGCYGFVSEASQEFILQDDYPFLCGQYWPPELDFFEHFSPEHTWYWRPNSMSLHSPNQYVGTGKKMTKQGGYCPTTLAPPGEAWCFGVSGAGQFPEDPTEVYMNYAMRWDPDGVDYWMNDVFMHRFTTDQMVMYLSGQLRPILIPEMPMFLTYNIALVRKGMDLSHGGEGLTDKSNYDPDTGEWKTMAMDIEYVRVYQDDTQGETRGLNPPITYQTRRKLLANKVTCNLVPELRCLVKASGTPENEAHLAKHACDKLKAMGDHYCEHIPKLCSLNNAGNPEGAYGLSNATIANMANQRLSLQYGICCIESDNHCLLDTSVDELGMPTCKPSDRAKCVDTPKTKLPDWLLESEYYQDPKLMYAKEGFSSGLAGTNPAGWKTYGMGLPRPPPPPPSAPPMAPA